MKCDKCQGTIAAGDERAHQGQIICEDCYIDAVSVVKPCDPWAVHAAKSLSGSGTILTRTQKNILDALKGTDGIELEQLGLKTNLDPDDLQREIATLRHMEKLKAVKDGDRKLFRLW